MNIYSQAISARDAANRETQLEQEATALEPVNNPYRCLTAPDGYDTVIGCFFDSFGDYGTWGPNPYAEMQGDIDWCALWAVKLGLKVHMVEAPEALKEFGLMELPAYPDALLELCHFERFGM